jgi:hypothetical protein
MIVSLHRKLDQKSIGEQERQFYSHGLTYLTTQSGKQVEVEDWMITEFEVEFMEEIATGGLCVFPVLHCGPVSGNLTMWTGSGQVYKGIWRKTEVAIKVLKTEAGVAPSSEVRLSHVFQAQPQFPIVIIVHPS